HGPRADDGAPPDELVQQIKVSWGALSLRRERFALFGWRRIADLNAILDDRVISDLGRTPHTDIPTEEHSVADPSPVADQHVGQHLFQHKIGKRPKLVVNREDGG